MKALSFDLSDIFIIGGCILTGYGLFYCYNLGILLAIVGVTLINLGVLRAILGKRH